MIPTQQVQWGGRSYALAVSMGHAMDMESECGAYAADGSRRPKPISDIAAALANGLSGQEGGYSVKDATAPLRIALIGGGMKDGEAREVVDRVVSADGFAAAATFSLAALQLSLYGLPKATGDDAKKKAAPSTGDESS